MRFAFRQLTKSPGFTAIAVLALALGIGANTAIFSVVYGVLLRPLPYPQQEQLVFLSEWSEQVPGMSVSYPNFVDFRARQKSFSSFGAARSQGYNYVGPSDTERLSGSMASADLFTALGVAPIRGRAFRPEDDRPGAERVALIRESLWRRTFGGRDSILGEQVNLSGNLYTIVGILPDVFQYPSAATEVWTPIGLQADVYVERGNHPGIYCIGRLKPGISFKQSEADLKAVAQQLAQEFPSNARQSVSLQLLTDRAFGQVRSTLFVLLAAAVCVLLIACANVANLQLARAHGRSREFAVRAALGAGHGRVIRQLLLESVLLGTCGCLAGIALGYAALGALKAILPSNIPRIADVSLNGWVLGFAIVLSLGTSVLFGLVPALAAARQDLREALTQGTRGSSSRGNAWRAALIMGEFALTSVLLVGAGLMIRTMFNLYRADPGFTTERLISFNWVLPGQAYTEPKNRLPKIEAALEALRGVPGVSAVTLVTPLPLSGNGNQSGYLVEGRPEPAPGLGRTSEYIVAAPNYFTTMQIRLVAGRVFGPDDRANTRLVAVVDTMFVQKNFSSAEQAVGQRFSWGGHAKTAEWVEIVGVVEHIQNYGLGQPTREQAYMPYAQNPPGGPAFVIRSTQDPAALSSSLRAAMRTIAPDLPIFGLRTMTEFFNQTIGTQRLTVTLLGAFGALALLLASVGLYGVLTYTVGQRTREIGVRMALGALPGTVISLVLQQGARLAGVGLLLGLLGALGASRLLSSVLYQVSPIDPLSFSLVAVTLAAVGLVACWLPARRATRVNPTEALRAE